MGQKPSSEVDMSDFSGMVSSIDIRRLPAGKSPLMINVMVIRIGELVVRRGLRELAFDNEDT